MSSTVVSAEKNPPQPIQETSAIDPTLLPDGKRIYIDVFRDRPGLDMSYKPNDFDSQFVLPVVRNHSKSICIYSTSSA